MQADLKSSQFTIFANLLNTYIVDRDSDGSGLVEIYKNTKSRDFIKKLVKVFQRHADNLPSYGIDNKNPIEHGYDEEANDVLKFIQDVFFNDFYDVIKSALKLPSRKHAKLWAFTILFGNESTNNEIKMQMKELYPTLIEIIDDFKKSYKSNQFPIGLKVLEAEIFIDNIWKSAIDKKITSFTRHDSLLFAISKRIDVDQIINETKERFSFIGNFNFEVFNDEVAEYYDFYDPEEEIAELNRDNHFYLHDENPNIEIDPDEVELIEKLVDIGMIEDYYGVIDVDLLEEISQLSFMRDTNEGRKLEEEVSNIKYGHPHFQEETNHILRAMIGKLSKVDSESFA